MREELIFFVTSFMPFAAASIFFNTSSETSVAARADASVSLVALMKSISAWEIFTSDSSATGRESLAAWESSSTTRSFVRSSVDEGRARPDATGHITHRASDARHAQCAHRRIQQTTHHHPTSPRTRRRILQPPSTPFRDASRHPNPRGRSRASRASRAPCGSVQRSHDRARASVVEFSRRCARSARVCDAGRVARENARENARVRCVPAACAIIIHPSSAPARPARAARRRAVRESRTYHGNDRARGGGELSVSEHRRRAARRRQSVRRRADREATSLWGAGRDES